MVRFRHSPPDFGSLAEWFMAPVLKTGEGNTSVGSNPTASASLGVKCYGSTTVSKTVCFGSIPDAPAILHR